MPPIRRRNRRYKKGEAYRDARKFILICEGNREGEYFEFFANKYPKLVVEIIKPTGENHGQSAPVRLKQRASEYIQREEWDESLDDEIWFILDTDRWRDQLHELVSICQSTHNWYTAISNPCFEVWLYYHRNCVKVEPRNAKHMKQLLNEQTQGGYSLDSYIIEFEEAINCSKNIDNAADQPIADLGVTKIYSLAEKVLELIPKKDGLIDM